MSRVRLAVVRAAGAAAGVALAGTAVGVVRRHRVIHLRGAGDLTPFGSLRTPPLTVVADDGVPLHVEVEEFASSSSRQERRDAPPVNLVFVHGYALNLDCWHFQRAGYRGLIRAVFYDQRSHGRSGRSDRQHANIDQLGLDLAQVLEHTVPEGPVVVVGHSMGGMTIVALAEQRPELFGDRIVGVGLISTTAGGLDPSRVLLPMVPARLGGRGIHTGVRALAHGHRSVDRLRRVGRAVATVATDRFAFGDDVPRNYLDFVDEMLAATPFEVVAEFFPSFRRLDKFDAVEVLGRVPTSIICGTADKLTAVGHSRKLHSRIAGSRLLECDGAGHMVIMERHEQVNAELDQLIAAATERVGRR